MIPKEIDGMKVIECSVRAEYGPSRSKKGNIAYFAVCTKGRKIYLLECADDFTVLYRKSWKTVEECHMVLDAYYKDLRWERC